MTYRVGEIERDRWYTHWYGWIERDSKDETGRPEQGRCHNGSHRSYAAALACASKAVARRNRLGHD